MATGTARPYSALRREISRKLSFFFLSLELFFVKKFWNLIVFVFSWRPALKTIVVIYFKSKYMEINGKVEVLLILLYICIMVSWKRLLICVSEKWRRGKLLSGVQIVPFSLTVLALHWSPQPSSQQCLPFPLRQPSCFPSTQFRRFPYPDFSSTQMQNGVK